jgi:hypothetical protein
MSEEAALNEITKDMTNSIGKATHFICKIDNILACLRLAFGPRLERVNF